MNLEDVFCHNRRCPMYGRVGAGNIWRHTNYGDGHDRRRFRCKVCGKTFSETRGTAFYKLRTPRGKVLRALAMLVERGGVRAVSRAMGVKPETVSRWLRLAAHHAEEVSNHLIRDLHLTQCQVDELWTYVKKRTQISLDGGRGSLGCGSAWSQSGGSS